MNELGNVPKKESPIEQEMNNLSDCLASLDETVGRLRCKISLVLSQDIKKDKETTAKDASHGSPLLNQLKEFSRKVVSQNETISDFLDRIET